jgi:hypothetical protein
MKQGSGSVETLKIPELGKVPHLRLRLQARVKLLKKLDNNKPERSGRREMLNTCSVLKPGNKDFNVTLRAPREKPFSSVCPFFSGARTGQ